MSDWYQQIENKVTDLLQGTRDKDLRFFRVEEYLRMVKRVGEYSSSCRECNSFKYEVEKSVDTIGEAISNPGKARRNYDRQLGKLSTHMRKKHGFYPPFYFTYLLAPGYAFGATLVGFLVSFPFSTIDKWFFILPAFVLGLIVGNIVGAKKDRQVRIDNKLL